MDWKDLVQLVAPSAGAIASGKTGAGAFLGGYNQEMDKIRVDRLAQRREDQQKQQFGAEMGLKLLSTLQSMDDPVEQQQLLSTIAKSGDAFGLPKDMFADYPVKTSNEALVRELADRLKAIEVTSKIDLDDPTVRQSQITTKGGQTLTIDDAMKVAHYRPIDPKTNRAINVVKAELDPDAPKPYMVRGANGDIEPDPVLVTWNKRKRVFEDVQGNAMNVVAPYEKPAKETQPPTTEGERLAKLAGRIRDAEAKGDTVLAGQLKAERADILASQKELATAGRAPKEPPAFEPFDQKRFNAEKGLGDAWVRETKSINTMIRQHGLMQAAMSNYDKDPAAASEAILVTFEKILDPDSVVRESEYGRSAEGHNILQRMEAQYNRWFGKGGGPIPRQSMENLVSLAQDFLNQAQSYKGEMRVRYDNLIRTNKFDAANVLGSDATPLGDATKPAPTVGPAVTVAPGGGNALIEALRQRKLKEQQGR